MLLTKGSVRERGANSLIRLCALGAPHQIETSTPIGPQFGASGEVRSDEAHSDEAHSHGHQSHEDDHQDHSDTEGFAKWFAEILANIEEFKQVLITMGVAFGSTMLGGIGAICLSSGRSKRMMEVLSTVISSSTMLPITAFMLGESREMFSSYYRGLLSHDHSHHHDDHHHHDHSHDDHSHDDHDHYHTLLALAWGAVGVIAFKVGSRGCTYLVNKCKRCRQQNQLETDVETGQELLIQEPKPAEHHETEEALTWQILQRLAEALIQSASEIQVPAREPEGLDPQVSVAVVLDKLREKYPDCIAKLDSQLEELKELKELKERSRGHCWLPEEGPPGVLQDLIIEVPSEDHNKDEPTWVRALPLLEELNEGRGDECIEEVIYEFIEQFKGPDRKFDKQAATTTLMESENRLTKILVAVIHCGGMDEGQIGKWMRAEHEYGKGSSDVMLQLAIESLLGITLHNMLEGMMIAIGAMGDGSLTSILVLSVVSHNLAEGSMLGSLGMSAFRSVTKTIGLVFLAACTEPLGGLIGGYLVNHIGGLASKEYWLGVLFAIFSSIMGFTSTEGLIHAIGKDPTLTMTRIGIPVCLYFMTGLLLLAPHKHADDSHGLSDAPFGNTTDDFWDTTPDPDASWGGGLVGNTAFPSI